MGVTKRGKGTNVMAVADRTGLPIAVYGESATPHKVALAQRTFESCFTPAKPEHLIGDKAYDSDSLDERLSEQGIEMIAPHKANRVKPKMAEHSGVIRGAGR